MSFEKICSPVRPRKFVMVATCDEFADLPKRVPTKAWQRDIFQYVRTKFPGFRYSFQDINEEVCLVFRTHDEEDIHELSSDLDEILYFRDSNEPDDEFPGTAVYSEELENGTGIEPEETYFLPLTLDQCETLIQISGLIKVLRLHVLMDDDGVAATFNDIDPEIIRKFSIKENKGQNSWTGQRYNYKLKTTMAVLLKLYEFQMAMLDLSLKREFDARPDRADSLLEDEEFEMMRRMTRIIHAI
jgi:hypothetical protein